MPIVLHPRRTAALTGAVVASLLLCSCSGSAAGDDGAEPAGAPPATPAIALPAEYEDRALTATVLSNYAPLGFLDADGELAGLDRDFALAIGEKIGVEVEAVPNAWENGLLGIESGTYDWTGSAAITPERLEKYDMTSYFTTGDALVVLDDSPEIGDAMTDLCGMSVGTLTGDRLADELVAGSAECEAAGEPAIDVQVFPAIADAQLATKSGNLDAWFTGKIYAGYMQSLEPGVWKVTGPSPRTRVVDGFITRKGSGLAEVLAEAVNELIADGTYEQILADWGIDGQALEVSEVNPVIDEQG